MASLCEARLGIRHISTGEIFRQEIAQKTPLGRRVAAHVANGRLVPDALVVRVMAAHLRPAVLRGGFVLDGFPRTQGQAAGLDRVLRRHRHPLDGAVYLTSPQALLIKRLSGRRVCSRCGANYHVRTMKPKRPGRCDRCGGALMTRKDDQIQTIRKRLSVVRAATNPLLRYYRRSGLLHLVDGRGHIDTVFRRAMNLFRQQRWASGSGRDDRTQKRPRN